MTRKKNIALRGVWQFNRFPAAAGVIRAGGKCFTHTPPGRAEDGGRGFAGFDSSLELRLEVEVVEALVRIANAACFSTRLQPVIATGKRHLAEAMGQATTQPVYRVSPLICEIIMKLVGRVGGPWARFFKRVMRP
jgi:hypothetical protein